MKSNRLPFYYCSTAVFSEHGIILTAAAPKVSENLFFVITTFFINCIYYCEWNTWSNKDLEEYGGYNWDVQLDPSVKPQVHTLMKRASILMIILKWKKALIYAQHKILALLLCPLFI